MRDYEVQSLSAETTRRMGAALADAVTAQPITAPIVVYLSGELGAGKTTFAGGFLRALGANGPIKSPTYTLIEPYECGERAIYHLDLYRVVTPHELEMLALRDFLQAGAVWLVEWAERGGQALPSPDLTVRLAYSEPAGDLDSRRHIGLAALTQVGESLLNKLVANAS